MLKFTVVILLLLAVHCSSEIVQLTSDNWTEILKDEWIVVFVASWCPACRSFKNTWNEFSKEATELGVKLGEINIANSPGLAGRFMITALPSIFHVKDNTFRSYKSSRDVNSLISLVRDKKWKNIEPISYWRSPGSFHMGTISAFFELSQKLRDTHNYLTSEYGMPSWASYALFGIITVILGTVLGILIVCVIDFIHPKQTDYKSIVTKRADCGDSNANSLLPDDEIKDDLIDDSTTESTGIESKKDQ